MQIFLPYSSPLETAKVLDSRRLNKQISECNLILSAAENPKSLVRNHPIYKMYHDHLEFVANYMSCLSAVKNKHYIQAEYYSKQCLILMPDFLDDADWYFDNFKKRLYTKDPEFYSIFKSYGTSVHNYYFVNEEWLKY